MMRFALTARFLYSFCMNGRMADAGLQPREVWRSHQDTHRLEQTTPRIGPCTRDDR
jgi:hypothetical protein